MTGITSEWNETSRSRNAKLRTKTKTYGAADFILSFQSFDAAASPVTAYSTPETLPTVAGRMSLRRVSRASLETLSVPEPTSGTNTRTTLPSGETSE